MLVLPLLEIIRNFDCEFNEDESLICYNNKEFQNIIDIYNTPFFFLGLEKYFEGLLKVEGYLVYRVNYGNSGEISFNSAVEFNRYRIFIDIWDEENEVGELIAMDPLLPKTFGEFFSDCHRCNAKLTWNQRSAEKIKKGFNPFFI